MCFVFRTIFYHSPITLREVSRLCTCSLSKVSREVKLLEKHGLVKILVKGRSFLLFPALDSKLCKLELLKEEVAYTLRVLTHYPFLVEKLAGMKGKVVLLFGSYAAEEANELSDVDILIIDERVGKSKNFIRLPVKKFKKLLFENEPMVASILKKHAIISGFETFVDWVMEWKRESLHGV